MKSLKFHSFACFRDKFRSSFVQVSYEFRKTPSVGTSTRPDPAFNAQNATSCADGAVLNYREWSRNKSRMGAGLSEDCNWAARNMPCEQNRLWPFSNRWMSLILPVRHRTQNTTRSTRNNSPPPPGAQCWHLPLRRRARFRMHKYCQSTLSCRGRGGRTRLRPLHACHPSVRRRSLDTGNINAIHRLDQSRDRPTILEMVECKLTGPRQRNLTMMDGPATLARSGLQTSTSSIPLTTYKSYAFCVHPAMSQRHEQRWLDRPLDRQIIDGDRPCDTWTLRSQWLARKTRTISISRCAATSRTKWRRSRPPCIVACTFSLCNMVLGLPRLTRAQSPRTGPESQTKKRRAPARDMRRSLCGGHGWQQQQTPHERLPGIVTSR